MNYLVAKAALALITAAAVAMPASASTIFTSRAAFASGVTGATTQTFEAAVDSSYTYYGVNAQIGDITYSTPGGYLYVLNGLYYSDALTGTGSALYTNRGSMSGTPTGPFSAFGVDLRGYGGSADSFTISFSDNESFNVASSSSAQFFGVYLNSPVTSFTITGTSTSVYDNITVGNAASSVPEPGSLALFGLATLGFAAARRKSRQGK